MWTDRHVTNATSAFAVGRRCSGVTARRTAKHQEGKPPFAFFKLESEVKFYALRIRGSSPGALQEFSEPGGSTHQSEAIWHRGEQGTG